MLVRKQIVSLSFRHSECLKWLPCRRHRCSTTTTAHSAFQHFDVSKENCESENIQHGSFLPASCSQLKGTFYLCPIVDPFNHKTILVHVTSGFSGSSFATRAANVRPALHSTSTIHNNNHHHHRSKADGRDPRSVRINIHSCTVRVHMYIVRSICCHETECYSIFNIFSCINNRIANDKKILFIHLYYARRKIQSSSLDPPIASTMRNMLERSHLRRCSFAAVVACASD